jgi:hypothetical protein
MGFVQRALFTWYVQNFYFLNSSDNRFNLFFRLTHLVFLILLCFKLESKLNGNWFIIFLPIWIFDSILIIWVIIELIKRHHLNRFISSLQKYQFYIYGILLKITSQIMLCLKLEYSFPELYIVMIPIWLLLVSLIIYIGNNLLPKNRTRNQTQRQSQQQQQTRGIIANTNTSSSFSS